MEGTRRTHELPTGGVLVLGSNFGGRQNYIHKDGTLVRRDEMNDLSNATWRGLRSRLSAAQIDLQQCFFTNAWPYLHEGECNVNKLFRKWLRDAESLEDAKGYLLRTLTALRPHMIIALGPNVGAFLGEVCQKGSRLGKPVRSDVLIRSHSAR